jgi:hypothetical protein
MVYGFGGDPTPDSHALEVLEDATLEFVADIVQRASASASKPGKLRAQDFLYVIRKNAKQWGRAKELLLLKKEIEEAKRTTEVNESAVDTFEAYTVDGGGGGDGRGPAEEEPLNSGDEPVEP